MDSLSQSMAMDKLLTYAKVKTTTSISIVFYDVITLYFENDQKDEDDNTGLEAILDSILRHKKTLKTVL